MELKEGMYVRTKNGIGKITNLDDLDNVALTDNIDVRFGIIRLSGMLNFEIYDDNIVLKEPSFNIIDLIELGDYVNGKPVEEITSSGDYKAICINFFYKNQRRKLYLENKDIKSIVTKEQFKNMEYEVE